MGDRSEEHTSNIIPVIQELGFLNSSCNGIITSRSGRYSFWNDFRIKEFYLGKFFLSKGKVPMLALDDREKTIAMYNHHGVSTFRVINQCSADKEVTYLYAGNDIT